MVPDGRLVNLPHPDVRAVASGESIALFAPRGSVAAGDRLDLVGTRPRPERELVAAYRRWADRPVPGTWEATVVEVHPLEAFDAERLRARHVLADPPAGADLVVVRVFGEDGPVLSEVSFAARLRSVCAALR